MSWKGWPWTVAILPLAVPRVGHSEDSRGSMYRKKGSVTSEISFSAEEICSRRV